MNENGELTIEDIQKAFQKGVQSLHKKIRRIEASMLEAKQFVEIRQQGELLKCHLSSIPRQAKSIELENIFLSPPQQIKITLDPLKNGIENMEEYFYKARKLEDSIPYEEERLKEVQAKLVSAEAMIVEFNQEPTIEGGVNRLTHLGFKKFLPLTPSPVRKKEVQKKDPFFKIKRFYSCNGYWIFVGGDAEENERVTFKVGKGKDVWLHVANVPGSHVVIKQNTKGDEIPRATLVEAATLAVHFSKVRGGKNVPVTYTFVHHVKKAKNAPKGQVQFFFNKTIKASDEKDLLQKIIIRTNEKNALDQEI